MKKLATMLGLVLALAVAGGSSLVTATNVEKVSICHRTASGSNPYVFITVAGQAAAQAHLSGTGKGHFATRVGDDFLPSQWQIENRTCDDPPPPPKPDPKPDPKPEPKPEPKPQPPTFVRDTFAPAATFRVCGDPRLITRVVNRGSTPVRFRVAYTSGRNGERIVFFTKVRPGVGRWLHPRWVRGNSHVRITANAPGFDRVVLVNRRLPDSNRWGTAGCPSGLRG